MKTGDGETFKDHFSGHAGDYARARPGYPETLFDWLAQQCPGRTLAWDAGCGNGQSALALARRFDRVVATDPSAAQIAAARAHPAIEYRVEPAEATSLDDGRVDLVTIAQALHWLDLPRFYAQVQRVARPGAIVAAWSYGLSTVCPDIDAVYTHLYQDLLGAYWPPERVHIENGYRDLAFPFPRLQPPSFAMRVEWSLPQYLAYLRSWSAAQRHLAATGTDAVAQVASSMREAWGEPDQVRTVSFPLSTLVGRR